tara:strand:- start:3077 stop:3865 length:789 start_codon:yes stop_codon:yes gene_type:complete
MIQPNTAFRVWISSLLDPASRVDNRLVVSDKEISRVQIIGSVVAKTDAPERNFMTVSVDDGSGQIQMRCWSQDTDILKDIRMGMIVHVLARVAEYNNVVYLRPELVKEASDPNLETYHRAKLLEQYGPPVIAKQEWSLGAVSSDGSTPVPEINSSPEEKIEPVASEAVSINPEPVPAVEVTTESVTSTTQNGEPQEKELPTDTNSRVLILEAIEKLDGPDGASVEEVITESNLDADGVQGIIDDLVKNGEVFMLRPGRIKAL